MWQGIYGHDEVVERFRRSLAAGRVASTYLFVGPEGVGKRQFAYALAKSLLCTGSAEGELDPCNECTSCRLADSRRHPDLFTVARRANIKVLQVDQFIGSSERRHQEGLCHDLSLRPLVSRRRVAIVDDADWFNLESANCLLKMLEEPPPGAVIILIGTSRTRQLPTILSRSQAVRFDRLEDEELAELALKEGLADDRAAAVELARRSEGSVTRAKELADAELWQLADRIAEAWQRGRFSAVEFVADVSELVSAAGKEADARRQRLRRLVILVGDRLRRMLRREDLGPDEAEAIVAALERGIDAEEQIDRNVNQATLIESWLDDLVCLACR